MKYPKVQLSDHIYWVGTNDRKTHLFENYWPLPTGIAYNSYLIIDDKVTLVDTVSTTTMDTYLEKLKEILGSRTIDYLIINHMEPDHSGAVKTIVNEYPNITIIGNNRTFPMLDGFYGIKKNLMEVDENTVLYTGQHEFHFYLTPMVHWPETMMTYESNENILFSADAFGSYGTLNGGIFDDEVNFLFYEDEMRRYYSNIVGKYGLQVQKALDKLSALDLRMIASTHGPIWRTQIDRVLEYYKNWSTYKTEQGVVIVFGSMQGNTEKMADIIARAIAEEGIRNIKIYDVSKTHSSYIISDIWKYQGVMLGSSAYNGGIFTPMRDLLMELEHIMPKNHYLSIFGSMSWGGGGVSTLKKFAENIKWEMIGEPLEVKHGPNDKDIIALMELGRMMARRLKQNDLSIKENKHLEKI
ncbi:MAG TPA: FprA family A-type flavoprotein [Bacteroidales bacterium]|nr:FprA family A-type flavoprotein [Bacteroidales bacterium]